MVVKLYPPGGVRSEAAVTAGMNHPNLGPALDAGVYESRPYWVARYVDGPTLATWARTRRPSAGRIARLFAELADALEVVHAAGVLHLDVKPANVLVGADGRPVLIDFGLSVGGRAARLGVADAVVGDGALRGTPAFMAPEQAARAADRIGPATDLYGLGATLSAALAGRPVPLSLRAIIRRATADRPADRYPSAAAMAVALRRAATARRRRGAGLAAALTAAAGVAAAWAGGTDGTGVVPGAPAAAAPTVGPAPLLVRRVIDGVEEPLGGGAAVATDDLIRLRGRVAAGEAGALFAVDPTGRVTVLRRSAAGPGERSIVYPGVGEAAPLVGPAGTEIVGFAAGRSLDALDAALNSLPSGPPPPLPAGSVLAFGGGEGGGNAADPPDRRTLLALGGESRSLGEPVPVAGAGVRRLESRWRRHFADGGVTFHAVAIAHRPDPDRAERVDAPP